MASSSPVGDAIVNLFREIAAGFPAGVASTELQELRDGVIVRIVPTNRASAVIWAHVDQSQLVDFGFGESGCTWELPYEGYAEPTDRIAVLQEVRELCEAVAAGRCEVTVGLLWTAASIQTAKHSYGVREL